MLPGTVRIGAAIVWIGAMLAAGASGSIRAQEESAITGESQSSLESYRSLLDRYCVTCHNTRAKESGRAPADLAIDALLDAGTVPSQAEVWEKVIEKLKVRAMPPPGLPRPVDADRRALLEFLVDEIDSEALAEPWPGSAVVHRLNRVEYGNAIRDLLGVEVDVGSLLPADVSNFGFDNIAEEHSMSSMRLERYISAARRVAKLAIGAAGIDAAVAEYSVPRFLTQDSRMSEDLPFGSAGGVAVRHHFPLDGEYVIRVRLRRNLYGYIRGLSRLRQLDVRVDGERVALASIGDPPGTSAPVKGWAGGIQGSPEWEDYVLQADEALEFPVTIKAGLRTVGVAFEKNPADVEGVLQPQPAAYARDAADAMDGGNPQVAKLFIAGPYGDSSVGDTPTRRRVFVCRPTSGADKSEKEACATSVLSKLGRRAYRRPIFDSDLQALLPFYREGEREGGFEVGIQRALERILVDPEFLYRVEADPVEIAPGTTYRINSMALASRLSFFLWSSIPDDELLELASRGDLEDEEVLEAQVRRMLNDPRASALISNFAAQWLELRKIEAITPDAETFRGFTENLRRAFVQEATLFLESQMREDRSVVDLLTANYTFVNDLLAEHYGIPNVYGSHFRRVSLPDDMRNGLLGKASILMATSYPNRTSPVLRGKWLLENIIGAPPPPPPPNVPALEASNSADGAPRSVRDRLEMHRANPVCGACHNQIDPLGFALENFDAIGRWRSTDAGGRQIDASGSLPDGTSLDGPAGLGRHLVENQEGFVETFTEKLLTYALGRGVDYRDRPTVRKITREAAETGFRWSDVVLGVVRSAPFQMRRVPEDRAVTIAQR